ncbi:unnamed protein product [Schistosoma rodhaini]|uniref:Uncharacterized protein n=1 Tax=Schistosoma rodhaini TaxID=6188 RepID=A0A183QD51_9TREM|nr:unnamed protein product [Schistosoma rodhaini]CAH8607425.1 unnamed protein product [Schistosoma rodhaini]
MSSIDILIEKFYWNSICKTIWKENFDDFDEIIDWIHSETVVMNAIIHSNNEIIPSYEKIIKTINFLKQNNFWRSNPFSLLIHNNNETIIKENNQLYIRNIKNLWGK